VVLYSSYSLLCWGTGTIRSNMITEYILGTLFILMCGGYANSKEEAVGAFAIAFVILGYLIWRSIA
jgi:hypothetical protein